MAEQYGQLVGSLSGKQKINGTVQKAATSYEKNYEILDNKPSINSHTLIGDSNFEDIGLHFMTNVELKELLGG